MAPTSRESEPTRRVEVGSVEDRALIRAYVTELQTRTKAYTLPVRDARRAVDDALGGTRLTDLLHSSRNEDAM